MSRKKNPWKFTTWKSKDPCNEEFRGICRYNGKLLIMTKYFDTRKEALDEAKERAKNPLNEQ